MKTVKPQNTPLLIITLFCALINACASKKDVIQNTTIEEANPKIIFLNYTLSEDFKGEKNIQFINKIITDGKLKNRSNKYVKTGSVGDLKCSQLDEKSNTIQSTFIKNPLKKRIEFVNDSLQFENKTLKLKKASLSLRLQLHVKTKQIVIAEIIDTLKNVKPLYITKLKTK